MAQGFSGWSVTSEAQVRFEANLFRIYAEQSGNRTGFSLLFLPDNVIQTMPLPTFCSSTTEGKP